VKARGGHMLKPAISRFILNQFGVAASEFALLLPILIALLTGCFEVSRFILLRQKLDRASSSVSDLVSQSTGGVTPGALADIFTAADDQTQPFDLRNNGRVIVSSVFRSTTADPPFVEWQCWGGGSYVAASKVGTSKGGDATMPSIDMGAGWNVIVAEVYYDYEPFLFRGIFEPQVFYHRSITRPRGGAILGNPGATAGTGCLS
jgi:TadE-like protein